MDETVEEDSVSPGVPPILLFYFCFTEEPRGILIFHCSPFYLMSCKYGIHNKWQTQTETRIKIKKY